MKNIINLKHRLLSWVTRSPEEALLVLGVASVVMFVAMFFCFTLIFKVPANSGELPSNLPHNTKMPSGWIFLSRDLAGTDVCDLYQKGMSYKVKCYGKDDNGKWFLREVF